MIQSDGLISSKKNLNLFKLNFVCIILEPGYYVEDKFGIRLETDIETVEAKV